MRSTIITLVFVVGIILSGFGQLIIRDNIRIRDTMKVERYKPVSDYYEIRQLGMAPGDHRLKDPSKAEELKGQGIVRVELVYSDFPMGEDFSELNRMRIIELYKFLPNAFNDKGVEWSVVVQTGVEKTGNIQSYFHGFVIHYRPYNKAREIEAIERIVEGGALKDSTILRVLDRNKDWKNMLIVADVTGSMTPYTAQLVLWLKLNTNSGKAKHFTFFNDGDAKLDTKKEKGKTGGIYHIKSAEYKVVASKAIEAMSKGNGGDMQENDVEAIIKAIKECPDCKDVVLVADNMAPVRDMDMMKEIKKPIKIILCGTWMGINTQYLELARATGGSIHTIETDITHLLHQNEGSIIELEGEKFKIMKGKFVKIKDT